MNRLALATALTVLVSCNDSSENQRLAAENDVLRQELGKLRADLQRCTEPAAKFPEEAAYAIDVRDRIIQILTAGLTAQATIPRKLTR